MWTAAENKTIDRIEHTKHSIRYNEQNIPSSSSCCTLHSKIHQSASTWYCVLDTTAIVLTFFYLLFLFPVLFLFLLLLLLFLYDFQYVSLNVCVFACKRRVDISIAMLRTIRSKNRSLSNWNCMFTNTNITDNKDQYKTKARAERGWREEGESQFIYQICKRQCELNSPFAYPISHIIPKVKQLICKFRLWFILVVCLCLAVVVVVEFVLVSVIFSQCVSISISKSEYWFACDSFDHVFSCSTEFDRMALPNFRSS